MTQDNVLSVQKLPQWYFFKDSKILKSPALMILDGEILIILKYPIAVPKPMVDMQWLQM